MHFNKIPSSHHHFRDKLTTDNESNLLFTVTCDHFVTTNTDSVTSAKVI